MSIFTASLPHNRLAINYDYCKGCGLCEEECPCGAIDIDMVKEGK